jgi:hypothetical protein
MVTHSDVFKGQTMKITRNLGMLVLAIYLILVGLSGFINIGQLRQILDLLALVAGVLLLIGR